MHTNTFLNYIQKTPGNTEEQIFKQISKSNFLSFRKYLEKQIQDNKWRGEHKIDLKYLTEKKVMLSIFTVEK